MLSLKSIGFIHPAVAIGVQLALGLLTHNYWYGVVGAMLFIGREHAQAEYRWIEHFGSGLRKNLPWWGAFDRRVWDTHSMTDWLLPLVFTTVVAILSKGAHT